MPKYSAHKSRFTGYIYSLMKKRIAILGATGSIGTQTLEVVRAAPEHFEVVLLTARDRASQLIAQALEFRPAHVLIQQERHYAEVKEALAGTGIQVHAGTEALAQIVTLPEIDIVLTALVGYAGLLPTLNAIRAGKDIALANKETLVVAGELVMEAAQAYGVRLLPVDSEHSAIFQCLTGERMADVEKIILTASGGPFRGKKTADLLQVTKEQALRHPNWAMGAKITIDSASLMNKGLEVIEAKWLFGLRPEQIEVVVHPQSIIHSMVQFSDGSIKAQMGLPDMRLPILYALSYPERVAVPFERFSFTRYPALTFEQPDYQTFRNLALAFQAMQKGGNMPCILNAANEIAVERFLTDQLSFTGIWALNEYCMEHVPYIEHPTLEDYIRTDEETRSIARAAMPAQVAG